MAFGCDRYRTRIVLYSKKDKGVVMVKSYTEKEVVVNGIPDLSMIPSNVMDMLVAALEKEITRITEEDMTEQMNNLY